MVESTVYMLAGVGMAVVVRGLLALLGWRDPWSV